ncbi:MAG: DUF3391 domain-containing protein [Rubrivivax sp.]|nr:DUF3391 domain-containing protein [Rubrivivax sp.]
MSSSPRPIDVRDLCVGMYIRLDLGWMAHPFPRSSFCIADASQIEIIRGLGVQSVTWFPERSTPLAAPGADASGARAAPPPPAPPAVPVADAGDVQARRTLLREQRQALEECQAQYDEAAAILREVNTLLDPQPQHAAQQAHALAAALGDKMLAEGELCIRLLSVAGSERAVAHALNVTVLSMLLGRTLGLPPDALCELGSGALLHDIGKLDLPARVHFLEDSFSSAEQKAHRDHVTLGVQRAQRMQLGGAALAVLAQHHEMADGSGYPQRRVLETIHPAARLVALVNRYDNLCNPGPRGVPLTPHEAVSVLFTQGHAQGRGKFDAAILGSFIRMMGVYPAGSVVQLSDERYALVMQVNGTRPLQPLVLVYDPQVPRDEALLVDLEQEPGLGIRRSLAPTKLPLAAATYLAPRPRVSYFFDIVDPACAIAEPLMAEAP